MHPCTYGSTYMREINERALGTHFETFILCLLTFLFTLQHIKSGAFFRSCSLKEMEDFQGPRKKNRAAREERNFYTCLLFQRFNDNVSFQMQTCHSILLLLKPARTNRPFASSSLPPLQSESKCEVFLMKIGNFHDSVI